ncbi:hypothetical protein AB4G91_07810 [Macrococcoides goetzii]|uniref:hypothetical protein n=1 Tax=Macrococcus sp. PK TaxID=2801919 RepID=UPI001F115240|nr:hypothetical protein [Macrococcus sp. PK]MCH4984414.1 hypothetical protein [Macrococcus sp. PK]MCH4985185.1 hypothetical protein [Macrococcus sp. PK]
MKKVLIMLLVMLTILFAACGGLAQELDGNRYIAKVGAKDNLITMGYMTFRGDKVIFSSDESKVTRTGTVTYDEQEMTIKLADNPVYKDGVMKLKDIKGNEKGLVAEFEIYSESKKENKEKTYIKLIQQEK